MRQFRCRPLFAALALAVGMISAAQGDLIKLHNGGEVRGTIEKMADIVANGQLTIITLGGAQVTVSRADIQFVARRPLIVEVYETRAKQTPNTLEAQWELAEWCRQKGVTLKTERNVHLRRILRLDPEHKQAHAALKHTKRDGIWMTYDEDRRAQGFVKHRGKYITPQELELIQKTEAELEAERGWYKKVRLWKGWLTGRNQQRRKDGFAELSGIIAPHAVAALAQKFRDEKNPQLRAFYVKILAGIPGNKPVPPLVEQSLKDSNHEIRYAALNAFSPDQHEAAMKIFARRLKDKSNAIVRRAGRGLERVGDDRVVPDLIRALVTTHRYRVRVPANSGTMSFNTNGSFGNPGQGVLPPDIEVMLRTGQLPNGVIINNPASNQLRRTKIIKVNYDHQNAEVLLALQKLTGVNYGYDERNWRLWWSAKKNGTANFSVSP
jgi:hypothetical protein